MDEQSQYVNPDTLSQLRTIYKKIGETFTRYDKKNGRVFLQLAKDP